MDWSCHCFLKVRNGIGLNDPVGTQPRDFLVFVGESLLVKLQPWAAPAEEDEHSGDVLTGQVVV